jgi:hypothetical protein
MKYLALFIAFVIMVFLFWGPRALDWGNPVDPGPATTGELHEYPGT